MEVRKRQSAFSLVELSIVLVILGLLTGGILAGQSLIRASELRAVSTEYSRYYAAMQSFRDKYFSVPGDFSKATSFWGYQGGAGCTNNAGGAVTASGACDGNGNNQIEAAAANGQTADEFQLWRQLALAGLVEGNYTGISGAAGVEDSILGTNVPKSKFPNAGWAVLTIPGTYSDTQMFSASYGTMMEIGAKATNSRLFFSAFKSEEAWNIDTKTDDGKPGTGRVIARENATWTGSAAGKCTTSASATDYAGTYNLSSSSINCALYFPNAM